MGVGCRHCPEPPCCEEAQTPSHGDSLRGVLRLINTGVLALPQLLGPLLARLRSLSDHSSWGTREPELPSGALPAFLTHRNPERKERDCYVKP